ncbi:MAG: sensor domain-containing diguanylate cyclase, partial [Clostridia bacterium]|nr:sensor domain-containing diguanylate cyclase [Clostridia bacterium]
VTLFYTKRITTPITQLTEAANLVDTGDYSLKLDYESNDEVGHLTQTFKRLATHMKDNISNLNRQVYVDSLTHVKNQGAFTAAVDLIQKDIDAGKKNVEFAIGVFDCDELKSINDKYGHDKGNTYLRTASSTICNTFHHSPVFRVGGDEFAVILQDESFINIDSLVDQFDQAVERINSSTDSKWEQVQISMGIAIYDKSDDHSVYDVVRRADKNMYENKRKRKKALRAAEEKNIDVRS